MRRNASTDRIQKRWHEQAVPWAIFIWVLGIFTLAVTTAFVQVGEIRNLIGAETQARINADIKLDQNSAEIKTTLAGIQADLKNLEERIVELRTDIKLIK